MTGDFPDLKLKAQVNFPAQAYGGTGLNIVKSGGNYTVNLDYSEFIPPVSSISDPAHQNALLWNSVTQQYVLVPVSLFGVGGSISEAPNDGQQYARQSLGWSVVAGSGGSFLSLTGGTLTGSIIGTSARFGSLDLSPGVINGRVEASSNTAPSFVAVGQGPNNHIKIFWEYAAAPASAAVSIVTFGYSNPIKIDASVVKLQSVSGGAATAPTPTAGDNSTNIATTAFVQAAITASGGVTPAALTRTNDTNVTLTLGGLPGAALLQATSITVGWAGTLATSRGGFGLDISAQSGVPLFNAGVPTFTPTTGTGNFVRAADPVFTGNPTAPTPPVGDNDTSIATTAFVALATRERLVAPRTYFVSTSGNDGTNNGLSAGAPFRTIQKAVNIVAMLDIAGQNVTVQLADGTYTEQVNLPNVLGFALVGNLVIRGNNATPANVIVSATSGHAFTADTLSVVWDILDLKMQTATFGHCLNVVRAKLRYGNVNFGPCANAHIIASQHGTAICLGPYAVSGGAGEAHVQASDMGLVLIGSTTITFSGTVAFGNFTLITMGAVAYIYSMTFANGGIVTGPRYFVASNGLIQTNGGGASYLPGSSPGVAVSQGQYM
jgi:hypothetical protein